MIGYSTSQAKLISSEMNEGWVKSIKEIQKYDYIEELPYIIQLLCNSHQKHQQILPNKRQL